ncbi:hypothetical protein GCK72_006226 [Caenorhabditis remanei]|uniref:Uncharacterized protein n=1 Tax=Caenorhabditis remanei TaxID=31234 RepID=A0A6A5HEM9_CAERE|nr:hypothetical protein GCK72_006226 [Caenorhabditis remanei]KAF1766270.1 hypothetical protein GCK72_006226 [Caenorhabditis remanei]
MKENELHETTTPPEEIVGNDDINKQQNDEADRFLEHMSTNHKTFSVLDRTGLRLSIGCLLPITMGDNGEQRNWGSSIILNSADLEYPQVDYKLRVSAKKRFDPQLTCNRSKGTIKQNKVLVLNYQLPESSIKSVQLTLLIDGSPHEIPLCKYPKGDYYWIGKDTTVPGPAQLIEERKQSVFVKTDSTMKNVSPGRIENIPDGLKDFVLGGDGINSVCKLLYPYSKELFRDLSLMNIENFDIMGSFENGNATDAIAEEIVRRFHESTREKFTTTPAMLQ